MNDRFTNYAALLLRLSLGTMWLAHGLLKLLVFTVPGFAAFLTTQGMPALLAWPVVLLELAGGSLILLGVRGRLVSLALLPVLLGAASVHLANGWVFTASGGGWEYPAFLIVASIIHGLLGDGAHALAFERKPVLNGRTA
jgi:putative oxidoreductase